eukprot:TRINITY_DN28273_c0_g1_i1.p1 TRINITY_DN28273_c0_g1~~TRINITY_DN28273_c0_g1_i1.p1  ORF type:complete len:1337 (+),score=409.10 TRINITY_DN28273_c0_g1_i1:100-4011(+)
MPGRPALRDSASDCSAPVTAAAPWRDRVWCVEGGSIRARSALTCQQEELSVPCDGRVLCAVVVPPQGDGRALLWVGLECGAVHAFCADSAQHVRGYPTRGRPAGGLSMTVGGAESCFVFAVSAEGVTRYDSSAASESAAPLPQAAAGGLQCTAATADALVAGSASGSLAVWVLPEGRPTEGVPDAHPGGVAAAAAQQAGQVWTAGCDGGVALWDDLAAAPRRVASLAGRASDGAVAALRIVGGRLWAGYDSGALRICDTASLQWVGYVAPGRGASGPIGCIAPVWRISLDRVWSAHGQRLVSWTQEGAREACTPQSAETPGPGAEDALALARATEEAAALRQELAAGEQRREALSRECAALRRQAAAGGGDAGEAVEAAGMRADAAEEQLIALRQQAEAMREEALLAQQHDETLRAELEQGLDREAVLQEELGRLRDAVLKCADDARDAERLRARVRELEQQQSAEPGQLGDERLRKERSSREEAEERAEAAMRRLSEERRRAEEERELARKHEAELSERHAEQMRRLQQELETLGDTLGAVSARRAAAAEQRAEAAELAAEELREELAEARRGQRQLEPPAPSPGAAPFHGTFITSEAASGEEPRRAARDAGGRDGELAEVASRYRAEAASLRQQCADARQVLETLRAELLAPDPELCSSPQRQPESCSASSAARAERASPPPAEGDAASSLRESAVQLAEAAAARSRRAPEATEAAVAVEEAARSAARAEILAARVQELEASLQRQQDQGVAALAAHRRATEAAAAAQRSERRAQLAEQEAAAARHQLLEVMGSQRRVDATEAAADGDSALKAYAAQQYGKALESHLASTSAESDTLRVRCASLDQEVSRIRSRFDELADRAQTAEQRSERLEGLAAELRAEREAACKERDAAVAARARAELGERRAHMELNARLDAAAWEVASLQSAADDVDAIKRRLAVSDARAGALATAEADREQELRHLAARLQAAERRIDSYQRGLSQEQSEQEDGGRQQARGESAERAAAREFLTRTRSELVAQLWALYQDVAAGCRYVHAIITAPGFRSLLRRSPEPTDPPRALLEAYSRLRSAKGKGRWALSNFCTEVEKLHLGMPLAQFQPDGRVVAALGLQHSRALDRELKRCGAVDFIRQNLPELVDSARQTGTLDQLQQGLHVAGMHVAALPSTGSPRRSAWNLPSGSRSPSPRAMLAAESPHCSPRHLSEDYRSAKLGQLRSRSCSAASVPFASAPASARRPRRAASPAAGGGGVGDLVSQLRQLSDRPGGGSAPRPPRGPSAGSEGSWQQAERGRDSGGRVGRRAAR